MSVKPVAIHGAHQNYLLYPADGKAFRVPNHMPLYAAAAMGVVVRTAADAFFNLLGYPLIGKEEQNPEGILLIWGGTTSIGLSVLQFARARSVSPIFVIAAKEYFELLKRLGADECFDYEDFDVVEQTRQRAARLGKPISKILDAVGSPSAKTADTAAACGDKNSEVITMTVHSCYKMPFCTMYKDTQLNVDGVGSVFIPKREQDAERASEAFAWVIEHYGNGFEFPQIALTSGLLPLSKNVASGQSASVGFGKNVITHPIRA
ncbi:zinc-binding dehydrogenase [Citrobacter sp. Cb004]|uniref:zinc-binding dehydrogenase n=1 Tax=Citrobacter sp. Cb004 TaxID=2985006 RepID=UPI002574FD00|nr:zinc-binding dehydrogenase [Citrobacter sp. Cb004]MDM3354943.1 zinc-binding dehydrogenase [Citrobacter sp. Cb004]